MSKSPRHNGICAICEAEFSTRGGRMVHHGYKRPGDGFLHGACPGANRMAYELSEEACIDYRAMVAVLAEDCAARLEALPNETFIRSVRISGFGREIITERAKCVSLFRYWDEALQIETGAVRAKLRWAQAEVVRMDKRIAAWKPGALRQAAVGA